MLAAALRHAALAAFALALAAPPTHAGPTVEPTVGPTAAPTSELPTRRLKPRLTRQAGGPWVVMSSDRRHWFLYGLRGGVLHGPGTKPKRLALTGRPYRIAIAPGGATLAYTAEDDATVSIVDVATGAVRWRGGFGVPYAMLAVEFRDATTAMISTGCRVLALDLTRPQVAPRPLGATRCDEATARKPSEDRPFAGRFWYRPADGANEPRLLDVVTGTEPELPWTRDADVVVADDGARVCAARRYTRQPDVLCARPGEAARVAIPGVPRWMAMSGDGAQVAALIVVDDQRARLVVADLATGAVRDLGGTSDTRVYAVGRDLVTSHGPDGGATLWRLDRGHRGALFRGQEVEFALPTADPATHLFAIARGAGELFYAVRP